MATERFDTRTGRPADVIETAVAATGEFAHQAKKKATEAASEAAEGIAYAKHRVQEWAEEGAECVGHAAQTIAQDAAELIRKYPVPALLLAVGIGFCLARTLRHT